MRKTEHKKQMYETRWLCVASVGNGMGMRGQLYADHHWNWHWHAGRADRLAHAQACAALLLSTLALALAQALTLASLQFCFCLLCVSDGSVEGKL